MFSDQTHTHTPTIPRALAIAASDSSGAAGLQADLKTFEARQVYGLGALTAVTAQDSQTIHSVLILEPSLVAQQIRAVLRDIGADVIKTGLLFRAPIIETVAETLAELAPSDPSARPLVVDPVLVAGNGRLLVDEATIGAYRNLLFPRALIITPNLDEAHLLTGHAVSDLSSMREAALALHAMGPRYVLVKGGHLPEEESTLVDVLLDGLTGVFHEFRSERLPVRNARGTGCTFASCIAAELARQREPAQAVEIARRYVAAALAAAIDWQMGSGRGTVFHSVGRAPLFG